MPERKTISSLASGSVTDARGTTLNLTDFRGREIRWARKRGQKLEVMLAGRKGQRGDLIVFSSSAMYERSVHREYHSTSNQGTRDENDAPAASE